MKTATILPFLATVLASPVPSPSSSASGSSASGAAGTWMEAYSADFPVHWSCNVTQQAQLKHALAEVKVLASNAKEHLLRYGRNSPYTQRYFGNQSTAAPIGWYERVLSANKLGMLFRCDDPDRNCATQNGWAGHWRGSNATQETVICEKSFVARYPLEAVCGLGYTVASSPLNTYFAVDLLHRIFHMPGLNEDTVDHFAGNYTEVVALAKSSPSKSVIDSNALQMFAIDTYAHDVAYPGVGCTGRVLTTPVSSAAASAAMTSAASSRTSAPGGASTTVSAGKSCHTHADGVVHCE